MRTLLGLTAVGAMAIGCRSTSSTSPGSVLVDTWDTPEGLLLTLRQDGSFTMGSKRGTQSGGTWKESLKTVQLDTTTLAGRPLEAEVERQLKAYALPMSVSQRKQAVESSRRAFQITLAISPDHGTLTWLSNGQSTLFTRTSAHSHPPTDAEIKKVLHKGMPLHEVMRFFRTGEASMRTDAQDSAIQISDFDMSTHSSTRVARVRFQKTARSISLFSVEIVEGSRRHFLAIR